jgi:hypothetical protein
MLQQTGMYFSSDRVTVSGLGIGAGARLVWRKVFVGQADMSILWGSGNALASRLSVGMQRQGTWSPAFLGTFALLWGQRTEVLTPQGERPPSPVWVLGVRIAPLRFEGPGGSVSALELGYGIGPDRGVALEATILTVGVRW